MVVIEVNVSKDIFDDVIDDVARLEQVVHTFRRLTHDDGLFRTWVFAINLLRDGFVYADRQNVLACNVAHLYLLQQPGVLLERVLLQLLRFQVVEREGDLLVLIILIIVILAEVCLLLGSDYATHQLYGRIVLPAIAIAFGLYRHLGQHLLVGL